MYDLDTPILKNGKMDIYYSRWKDILKRCYSDKFLSKNPSYYGCSVCKEWLTFSKFKAWLEDNSFSGTEVIDKDLIFRGNKVYGPQSCTLIDSYLNSFMALGGRDKNLPHGVGLQSGNCIKRYTAKISHEGKMKYIGSYLTSHEAHRAWQEQKAKIALLVSEKYSGPVKNLVVGLHDRIMSDLNMNIETRRL
ncbi:hypothetical protein CPT_Mydo_163 [Proteus phage Mydo]|uniref:Uncharacterized protein n=1 Tax=Proteus phage Mydo TaxID=2483610 RepID=A0A3G8F149_9CAUD|nr:HNH endonuclease [Proteus phage Mydo]AZF87738.1 hypothetical protein CPT_Mydo_163 [Proteus phage Mydo]